MWITILYIISLNILISVTNGNFQEKNFIRARIQDHPYQVSIQYKNYHICGGAVLSNFFILTAASCLSHDKENVLYANLKVLSGTDNLEKLDLDSSINDVEYVILHKKFDLQHQRHDIAILRLTRPLIFNLYRWTVSSPYDYKMFTYAHNTGHYITGWGKNSYTVENSTSINPRLQFVWVDLTKPGDCEEYIDQHCLKAITTPLKSGHGGSPIMENNSYDSYVTVGIVSIISIDPLKPTIYTRIHKYVGWIKTTMQKI